MHSTATTSDRTRNRQVFGTARLRPGQHRSLECHFIPVSDGIKMSTRRIREST